MRKVILLMIMASLICSAGKVSSCERKFEFCERVGISYPHGTLEDVFKNSTRHEIQMGYKLKDWFTAGLEGGYSYEHTVKYAWKAGITYDTTTTKISYYNIGAYAKAHRDWGILKPYLIGGIGYNNVKEEIKATQKQPDTDVTLDISSTMKGGFLGLNAGAGLLVTLEKIFFVAADVRYHYIFSTKAVEFVTPTFTLGINF